MILKQYGDRFAAPPAMKFKFTALVIMFTLAVPWGFGVAVECAAVERAAVGTGPGKSLFAGPWTGLVAHAAEPSAEASSPVVGAPDAPASADQGPGDAASSAEPRRRGVALVALSGLALAGGKGYPNRLEDIDNPASYTASGLGIGHATTFAFLGALSEGLNVGFWGGFGQTSNANWRSTQAGGGLRLEAYPFLTVLPGLRGLGVAAQMGVGSATVRPKRGVLPGAEGFQSFLGASVYYEWSVARLFDGHVAMGPSLDYAGVITRSLDRHGLSLGARVVFYGGQ